MAANVFAESAALTLWESFQRSLSTNAPLPALSFGGRVHTYADLGRAVANAARRLADAGVGQGTPVVILTDPGPAFPVTDLAIMALGAVKVPLNPQLAADEIAGIGGRVQPRAAVVSDRLGPLAAGLPEQTMILDDTVDWASDADLPGASCCSPTDPAVVYFTGGTTGRPKGIVHSQASVVTNLWAHLLEAGIHRDDRLLLTTPLAHAAGLFTLAGLLRGAYVRIEPGFDAQQVLEIVATDRITWTFAVPTMIYRLLDAVAAGSAAPTTLRTIQYGGAPISAPRLAQALEVFGPVLQQLYAQTECPNYAAVLRKEDHLLAATRPELLRSCGRPSLMCDVSILDESGQPLAQDIAGEICLRAPYVMDRYWDDPDGFAQRFFGEWLRTGDIGYRDDAGNVFIVDRRSDMIVSGGMNVYSLEVEQVLAKAPGVNAVAVIGVPHDDWGEAVHAVVVGDGVDGDALAAFARSSLAAYKRPKSYEFRGELPLTSFGKVDRKALRAPYWAAADRAVN
jgi:fatty-acyl-CoA synthase